VAVDGALCVRAYNGQESKWYRAAVRQKAGRILAAGLTKEVTFEPVGGAVVNSLDDAYCAKYRGSRYLDPIIGARVRSAALRIHTNRWKQVMNTMQFFVYGASVLATALGGAAVTQEAGGQYVQVAEIEVDPAQLDAYRAAVQEQIEAAIQKEPGVLVLYAVSEKEAPNHVKVFEIYRDRTAYEAHLGSDHFKKYKATVEKMVKSLKLVQATPIALRAK